MATSYTIQMVIDRNSPHFTCHPREGFKPFFECFKLPKTIPHISSERWVVLSWIDAPEDDHGYSCDKAFDFPTMEVALAHFVNLLQNS